MKATGRAGGFQSVRKQNRISRQFPAPSLASRHEAVAMNPSAPLLRSPRRSPVAHTERPRRRVLQVITPSHFSGAETQLVRMTHVMERRGHHMPILVKGGSHAIPEMRRRGVEVETAHISGKLNALAALRIAQAAWRVRADLVQSTLSSASWWSGWLEAAGGPKSVGHVQGFTSARWHRHQSHLLAVSYAVRDDLVQQGIPAHKITVLHNALDHEDLQPERSAASIRDEFGADIHTPVIGTIGHLSVKKGYRELFAAIPQVLARVPRAQFWVVGEGALRRELELAALAGGFARNVRFAGFRRDAIDILNAVDVFCLPSHREPCALVYLEAALLEKPVVACRAGGAPESIADGETGLLVQPRNGNELAIALLTLLDNRATARRMGQEGRRRAAELFSWDRFTKTLEGVYDRLLEQ
jgi:glycosyltransferase involved in cell wall biosynthesis